jgi:hypothetical protein
MTGGSRLLKSARSSCAFCLEPGQAGDATLGLRCVSLGWLISRPDGPTVGSVAKRQRGAWHNPARSIPSFSWQAVLDSRVLIAEFYLSWLSYHSSISARLKSVESTGMEYKSEAEQEPVEEEPPNDSHVEVPSTDSHEDEEKEPLPEPEDDLAFAVDIGLSRTGDAGSAFHTTNDPAHPLQRTAWTLRKSSTHDVRLVCLDVIHGLVGGESSQNTRHPFATLIVLEFRFDPRKLRRRITWAQVELVFSADAPGAEDPVVAAIAPEGRLSMEQTDQTVSTVYGGDASVGASVTPASANVGGKWERTVGKTTKDFTEVVGSSSIVNRTYGEMNSVSWTLTENPTSNTGIISSMRAAIRLHRADEERFRCTFSLKLKADWKSELAGMGGSTPPDDPVLFDPTQPSTMKLRKYEEEELGKVNLEELSDITFKTIYQNSTKTK